MVTLPKGTKKIPQVEFGIPSISVNQNSGQVSLTPTTSPIESNNKDTLLFFLTRMAGSVVGEGVVHRKWYCSFSSRRGNYNYCKIETGLTFSFIPNPSITQTIKTTITVYGNETGGSQTIPVTVTYVQPT